MLIENTAVMSNPMALGPMLGDVCALTVVGVVLLAVVVEEVTVFVDMFAIAATNIRTCSE